MAKVSEGELRQGNFLTDEGLSWPRFKQGRADLEQLYGVSAHDDHEACLIASASGERSMGAELFRRIGDNWDTTVWRKQEDSERYNKMWALAAK